jgi:hypothetical protein
LFIYFSKVIHFYGSSSNNQGYRQAFEYFSCNRFSCAERYADIKPETRQAVLDLAKEWDYQPNVLATSLVKSRTKTLGVIVPDLGYHFFSSVIKGIEAEALYRGYTLLLTQTGESYERELVNYKHYPEDR